MRRYPALNIKFHSIPLKKEPLSSLKSPVINQRYQNFPSPKRPPINRLKPTRRLSKRVLHFKRLHQQTNQTQTKKRQNNLTNAA